MYFTSWNDLLLKTSSCKAKVKKSKNFMHSCIRTCNKFSWGEMLGHPNVAFSSYFPFTIPLIHPYSITPLTIHYTIFINKYGLPCYFSICLFLSILRELVIKYQKIDIFSFISQSCVSFVMCRNISRFSAKLLLKSFSNTSSTI